MTYNIENKCGIIVPIFKSELSSDETISLKSTRRYLSSHEIVFTAPRGLDLFHVIQNEECIERFDNQYFNGIKGYNLLMTSSQFYERFKKFSHVLICQLDCLVFHDELTIWCKKGFDYIAAPWFHRFEDNPSGGLWRVGNGGFSLRNVESHLRVLRNRVVMGSIYPKYGVEPWRERDIEQDRGIYRKKNPWYRRMQPFVKWVTVEEELKSYSYNEDLFWSLEAQKFDPSFRIASAEEALPFAFEMAPKWCFEKNGNKLPFGCHAWGRYDREFWLKQCSIS